MKSLFLALRNIFRNKRRTGITFMAIITGITGIVVFGGFVEFSYLGLRETVIKTQLGHIQIYKKGYLEGGVADPGQYLIKDPDAIIGTMSMPPHNKSMTMLSKRLTFSGLVSTGEKTLAVKGIGFDPEREKEMTYYESIVDGEQLTPEMTDGGVIGVELMKALGANVGDYVTVLTNTVDGVINAADIQIVGVAQTGTKEYDSVFLKLPISFVQRMLNTEAAEEILVMLEKTEDVPAVMARLDGLIAEKNLDLEMQSWDQQAVFYHRVVDLYEGIFRVVKIIIGIIVFFSIANTMTMSVFERVREIGTLRAMGTTRWGITSLFLFEGVIIGILGGLLGILTGIVAAKVINMSGGIEMSPPPGMTTGFACDILIVPKVLIFAFVLTVSVSMLSAAYPAIKAARLKIVDAIQYS